jgi:hypothetical protein
MSEHRPASTSQISSMRSAPVDQELDAANRGLTGWLVVATAAVAVFGIIGLFFS